MKNIVRIGLSVVISLSLTGALQAQALKLVGVKGGVNFAKVTGNDVGDEFESKTGLVFGGFANWGLSNSISLQPEVLLSAKGAKQTITEAGQKITAKINLTYLEIPLLMMVNLGNAESSITPMAFIGPAVGFNLSAKAKGEVDEGSAEIDVKEDIKSTEFALIFGAGFSLPVGSNKLSIVGKYNMGLTKIDDTGENSDVKNQVISIEAALGFNLIK